MFFLFFFFMWNWHIKGWNYAAILPSTKGWSTGHTIRDEKSSSKARVATHGLWRVFGMLVRTHIKSHLLAYLQKPPYLGIYSQTHHSKQVNPPLLFLQIYTFFHLPTFIILCLVRQLFIIKLFSFFQNQLTNIVT